jgi:hypothetical protein
MGGMRLLGEVHVARGLAFPFPFFTVSSTSASSFWCTVTLLPLNACSPPLSSSSLDSSLDRFPFCLALELFVAVQLNFPPIVPAPFFGFTFASPFLTCPQSS